MTDTRFSSAIHLLILISESEAPMTSEQIAESVGTNASYIRKLAALLRKAGIIRGRRGVGGFSLCVPSERLTLYAIYCAVCETEQVQLFDVHQNANDKCIVGRHIKPVLTQAFSAIGAKAKEELERQTLSDLTDEMRKQIKGGQFE